MTATVVARVFATPELLEHILLLHTYSNLKIPDLMFRDPATELFVMQRVNRDFNNTIADSKALRRLMFLEPRIDIINTNPRMCYHRPVQWLADSLKIDLHDSRFWLNTGDYVTTVHQTSLFLLEYAEQMHSMGEAWMRPEASFRKMLICNSSYEKPSLTVLLKITFLLGGGPKDLWHEWEYDSQTKLSVIFDRFMELAKLVEEELARYALEHGLKEEQARKEWVGPWSEKYVERDWALRERLELLGQEKSAAVAPVKLTRERKDELRNKKTISCVQRGNMTIMKFVDE